MALSAALPFRHHRSSFDPRRIFGRAPRRRSGGRLAGEIAVGVATLAIGGLAAYFIKERSQEEAEHRTLSRDGAFSLRHYPARTVAQVKRHGPLAQAMDEGFRPLADYIAAKPGARAGGDEEGEKLAMAVPVSVAPAAKSGEWAVRFTLPREKTRERLPEPTGDVHLTELPARIVAVVRFAGRGTDRKLIERQRQALMSWIEGRGLVAVSEPEFAAYNAPIVPGLLRRNEWWVEVEGPDIAPREMTKKVHKSL